MGKLDEMRKRGGSAAAESMGVGVPLDNLGQFTSLAAPAHLDGVSKLKNVVKIPLAKIDRDPDQPREEFDQESLERLANSLKSKGQLQPIGVRWSEEHAKYIVLYGERRWRAAGLAGLDSMVAVISEGPMSASEKLAVQVIENCLREDLKPIEQARAFQTLMETNDWTTREVAQELAVSQSAVVKSLALLNLPAEVQSHVEEGDLSPAAAYEITKIPDRAEQVRIADEAASGQMKRAELRERVQETVKQKSMPRTRPKRQKNWSFEVEGVARIRVEALSEEIDPYSILEAIKQAATAFKKSLPRGGRQDAA